MSYADTIYPNLCEKLSSFGYQQLVPPAAVPLVGAIFEDLVKSTESLRDAKKRIGDLLEEKAAWELGVEPHKCDNARLLKECNELHLQLTRLQDSIEEKELAYNRKIRVLQSDNQNLNTQNLELLDVIKDLSKDTGMKNRTNKPKPPFISTVRPGILTPPALLGTTGCTKCNANYYKSANGGTGQNNNMAHELEKLEIQIKDLTDEIAAHKRKIESRDREIMRLNKLLVGGRPTAALAKDCCYKDVSALNEDIELLQREKSEGLRQIHAIQADMHHAMKRALDLEGEKRELIGVLQEVKVMSLDMEKDYNQRVDEYKKEIQYWKQRAELSRDSNRQTSSKASKARGGGDEPTSTKESTNLNERYNALMQKKTELEMDFEHQHQHLHRLKSKINSMKMAFDEEIKRKEKRYEVEKSRLHKEREFFQSEFMRVLKSSASEREIEFLQTQINSKDEELRTLRAELCQRQQMPLPPGQKHTVDVATAINSPPYSSVSEHSTANHCVQAAVLRAERERDCLKQEVKRLRCEIETAHSKQALIEETKMLELQRAQRELDDLNDRILALERENHQLRSRHLPTETQVVLLKQENDELRQQISNQKEEHSSMRVNYNKLRLLHEQTERTLVDYQNKLAVAEHKLESAEDRVNTLDSNREVTHTEVTQLRHEIHTLKQTYHSLEKEKDKLVAQLDKKTERSYKLEYELKACQDRCDSLDRQVKTYEEQLQQLSHKTREQHSEQSGHAVETEQLRQQITALRHSREQAIKENGRLTQDLSESQAEVLTLKKKLKDSELEIDHLKQQLRTYVQEVKKAEDLLLHKEKEREEMLEHYRSLSHDAVLLEGNNQSLETEAAEYKRQVCDLEKEITLLKMELCCRNKLVNELEDQITMLNNQNRCLERQLEDSLDDQRLLKIDLTACKELCERFENERDKWHAELAEFSEIRQKLEKENENLRTDLEKATNEMKVQQEATEQLLKNTRRDLETQLMADNKLGRELLHMKDENEKLLKEIDLERQRREQQESMTHEFQIQNQELRHNMTDDRFRQARSREQSPRFPTTM